MSDAARFPHDRRIFAKSLKEAALARQGGKCAMCGAHISGVAKADAANHKYGERAEAHHIIPWQNHGESSLDNCVMLCWSCHFSAHGGDFSDYELYEDLGGRAVSTKDKIGKLFAKENPYPFYRQRTGKQG
jgi:hypothetical protein